MTTERRLLVLVTALVALAVVAPGQAIAKRGGTDRPLHGRGVGTSTADLGTGAVTSQGTSRFSHLGKSTFTLDTTFTALGPTSLVLSGTATFVAANGDRVFSTVVGTATFTGIGVGETATFTLMFTITGGTGRFADASGTVTATVEQESVSLVGTTLVTRDTFAATGTISY